MRYLEIKDLVYGSFFLLLKENPKNRSVSLKTLYNMGLVTSGLMEDTCLLVGKEATSCFLDEYSEFFKLESIEGQEYIKLKEGVILKDLRNIYGPFLTLDFAKVLHKNEVLEILLVKE